jgi:hypothetical protein
MHGVAHAPLAFRAASKECLAACPPLEFYMQRWFQSVCDTHDGPLLSGASRPIPSTKAKRIAMLMAIGRSSVPLMTWLFQNHAPFQLNYAHVCNALICENAEQVTTCLFDHEPSASESLQELHAAFDTLIKMGMCQTAWSFEFVWNRRRHVLDQDDVDFAVTQKKPRHRIFFLLVITEGLRHSDKLVLEWVATKAREFVFPEVAADKCIVHSALELDFNDLAEDKAKFGRVMRFLRSCGFELDVSFVRKSRHASVVRKRRVKMLPQHARP